MMVKRYELSDQQWKRIEPLLLGKPGDPGGEVLDLLGIWQEVHPLRYRISTPGWLVLAPGRRHLHEDENTGKRADA